MNSGGLAVSCLVCELEYRRLVLKSNESGQLICGVHLLIFMLVSCLLAPLGPCCGDFEESSAKLPHAWFKHYDLREIEIATLSLTELAASPSASSTGLSSSVVSFSKSKSRSCAQNARSAFFAIDPKTSVQYTTVH